jgi:predicted RNA-binding protein
MRYIIQPIKLKSNKCKHGTISGMHWLIVNSAENLEISTKRGFDFAGMKTRWKKAAHEVQPGDTVFYYVVGKQVIAAELEVTSETYFDETQIWLCSHAEEYYPWRFKTKPVKVLTVETALPVKKFIDKYEYATRWSPQHASLAFQGNVHRLNDHDYQLIHDLL